MLKPLSAFIVSITPFDEHGNLDEEALRRHLRRFKDAGVGAYLGGSGSGEGDTLSHEERGRLFAIGAKELKGHAGVRSMGFQPRRAEDMVRLVEQAARAKLDAAHVYSLDMGHGAKPTEAELEQYWLTVLDSATLPIVVSCHHAAGHAMSLGLLERLLRRFPAIVGAVFGGHALTYLSEMVARFGDRIEIHCAGPYNALTTLGLGGNGFLCHEGNFAPKLVAAVISAFKTGDRDPLRDAFGKLMAFHALDTKLGGGKAMRSMKPLLNAFGLPGGYLRPPRLSVEESDLRAIVEAVLELRIPEVAEMSPPYVRGAA